VTTIAAIEAWAAQQPDKPTRSEALRRLIDLGMKAAPMRGAGRKRGA
jgi:2-iminoacetate synthase ThiH